MNIPEGIDGSSLGLPEKFCEFGEGHFDRIEIGAVGRQEQEACAADEARRLFVLMARQIVGDHRVAPAQHGEKDLLDVGKKILGVDRSVEHEGGNQPLAGEARKERRPSMTVRRMAEGTFADVGPGVTTRHCRRRPSLVEENQPAAEAVLRVQRRRDGPVRWRAAFF